MSIDAIAYAKTVDLGEVESAQARLLLYVIAEHTFNDTFVCRICQAQMAYEAGRVDARTIRRHLGVLERARIIIRAGRRTRGGHADTDVIRIRGYKRWYLAEHTAARDWRRASKPADKLSAGAGTGSEGASRRSTSGQIVRPPADSRSPLASGHLVSGGYKESRTSTPVLSSPLPPKGEATPQGEGGKADQVSRIAASRLPEDRGQHLTELRADGLEDEIVERLIAPLLLTLRVPPGRDPVTYLRQMRDVAAASKVSATALDKAARAIAEVQIRDLPPIPSLGATLAKAQAAMLIALAPGDPRWAAWLTHDRRDPAKSAYAKAVERGRQPYHVTAEWPPGSPDVEQQPLGSWLVPWGTPEHAAHLQAMRRDGRSGDAQAADVGKHSLNRPSRWPVLNGPGDCPAGSRPPGRKEPGPVAAQPLAAGGSTAAPGRLPAGESGAANKETTP